MLLKVLLLVLLSTPADDAAAALALAKAARDRQPVVTAVEAPPDAYALFYRDVTRGAAGVLFVGRPVPTSFSEYRITLSVPSLDGVEPGVYQCDSVNGVAVMVPRLASISAPPVATRQYPPAYCPNGRCPK